MSGSAEPRRPAPARQVLEPLMTVEDLAAYLHKPVNTIYKMRAEGRHGSTWLQGRQASADLQREAAEWLEGHRDEI